MKKRSTVWLVASGWAARTEPAVAVLAWEVATGGMTLVALGATTVGAVVAGAGEAGAADALDAVDVVDEVDAVDEAVAVDDEDESPEVEPAVEVLELDELALELDELEDELSLPPAGAAGGVLCAEACGAFSAAALSCRVGGDAAARRKAGVGT
ncbi:MAG TPA: hypothetical protein VLV15_15205 [Dongiaceae bacterium]|nr:hypothetical protein [Dongiaceae bacterium]